MLFNTAQCPAPRSWSRQWSKPLTRFQRNLVQQHQYDQKIQYEELMKSDKNPIFAQRKNHKVLCNAIWEQERRNIVEKSHLQQLHEGSEEIRALKINLNYASCLRKMHEQRETANAKVTEAYNEFLRSMQDLEEDMLALKDYKKEKQLMQQLNQEDYKQYLALQMKKMEMKDAKRREQLLNEQTKLNEFARQLQMERIAKSKQDAKDKVERRNIILQEIADVVAGKRRDSNKNIADDNTFLKYLEALEQSRIVAKNKIQKKIDNRGKLTDYVSDVFVKSRIQWEENHDKLIELLVAERAVSDELFLMEKDKEKFKNRQKLRKELDDAYVGTVLLRETRTKYWNKKMMEELKMYKMNESDRDVELATKRRLDNLQYVKAMDKFIEVRAATRREEKRIDTEFKAKLMDAHRQKDKDILAERHRILDETPIDLLTFIPSNALHPVRDRKYLQMIAEEKAKQNSSLQP